MVVGNESYVNHFFYSSVGLIDYFAQEQIQTGLLALLGVQL
jgi:hypothetical protein